MKDIRDTIVFEGKTLGDIFEEIYENATSKKEKIDDLVAILSQLVKDLSNASVLAPIIKDYLEVGVKNDEQLIKLATINQRLLTSKNTNNTSEDSNLSSFIPEAELEELLKSSKDDSIFTSNEGSNLPAKI